VDRVSGSSRNNSVWVDGAGSTLNVSGIGSEIVVSGSTAGTSNALFIPNSGTVNTSAVQTGPGGNLYIGGTVGSGQAPSFINSSATITGNHGGLGSGGGVVTFTHTASSYQFANVMSGSLAVIVAGSGTTTLTGASSYTGTTNLAGGGLALGLNASIASSPESVLNPALGSPTFDMSAVAGGYQLASGQTLGGVGTVIGPATGVVGSTVVPGLSGTGTLTVTGGLTLLGDLQINIDGWTIGLLDGSSGSLTLGGSVTFNEINPASGNLIFAKSATLSGVFGSINSLPSGYSIDYNYLGGNQIALVTGVVPEIDPANACSVLALVGGALGMLERRRRRKA
jgi:autotransporter-associated beta strand protein